MSPPAAPARRPATSPERPLLLAGVPRLLVVGLLDRLDQLLLLHRRAAGDVELLGHREQVILRRVRVYATGGLPVRVPPTGRLRVGGTLLAAGLLLPMVADLLE